MTNYTEIRGQATGIATETTAPTIELIAGQIYTDSTTGFVYVWNGARWGRALGATTTSTSTSSTSSSSTSTSSTSTSSSSSSTSSTSTSSSSTSTSTTL